MAPSMYTLWLVVWSLGTLSGPVSRYCSLYGVAISFSSIEVPRLSLMVGCGYLHLYWSGAGRTSQETAIPGFYQQVLLGASNSVGFGVSRWNGSLGVVVSGWPFLQSLFHNLPLWTRTFLG